MKPSGVIFDFDGVIVDSTNAHLEAWNFAHLNLFGFAINQPVLDSLRSRSTNSISSFLCQDQNRPDLAQELKAQKLAGLNTRSSPLTLIPGVMEVIAELITQEICFGIASNSPRSFIEFALDRLNIPVSIYTGLEDYRNPKPDPEPFLVLARKLNIPIDEHQNVLVFEDSLHGIKAAKRAGMQPVGVTTEISRQELMAGGAIATCANLFEVLINNWLKSIPTKS